jgi:hypothetical protein
VTQCGPSLGKIRFIGKQFTIVPGEAGRGEGIVAAAAGDQLVNADADAAKLGVGAPFVIGRQDQIDRRSSKDGLLSGGSLSGYRRSKSCPRCRWL